ncbi:MAG: bifunctional demethylmenaquinone methyltransferase/2-methoxy-6-polyprenyl-1,4-benzoquinol methylase UbiE [Bacteroidetes bacterium]|nr:bifunctional demethylmenaquinone methyltransferase/2-methoxy-6-polyprenyl-1,4-benzoquinol methylase UbiE [Bacteroidota bacterium]MCY4205579.1 bifunctional demethylmenaquinone methyltransferase/2-methoxy-6-polyprenyl-1,4-benzoquinol methylase UbiE [Bacteroidota bacterium]
MRYYPPTGENKSKESQVATMFDAIAPRYDILNRVLSIGLDRVWRNAAIRRLGNQKGGRILDVATGTGDIALAALKLEPKEIIGIDIADAMLQVARKKAIRKSPQERVSFVQGSAEQLPFRTDSFDAAIVAFGVRNFANLHAGLCSIKQVLKPGAPFVVLEFSQPTLWPIKAFYKAYSRWILPNIGRIFSGVDGPYKYLPDSIEVFPNGQNFLMRLEQCGFNQTRVEPLTFGIVSLYTGYAT